MEKIKFVIFIMFLSVLMPMNYDFSKSPTGEDYITGEDGIKRIYVNIWGHVKNPGPYLVYENIDIITLLSIAGGPLDGADFSKVKIISKNSDAKFIDIDEIINSNKYSEVKFDPYDTIVLRPTSKYYILNNASAINSILQIVNIIIALQ